MTQPTPVQVITFAPRSKRQAPLLSICAAQVREAVALHRDREAVLRAQSLVLTLRQLAGARRDRPAFLHGALLGRATEALEEARDGSDPCALAEAREWLHALASSIARTWSFREGSAGPLDETERAARRAVHLGGALLDALERGALGDAVVYAQRFATELTLGATGRTREVAQLMERARALGTRLDGGKQTGLASIDPGDLGRPASPHGPSCPEPAARHASCGLIAFAMRDLPCMVDEVLAAAAHLRSPEALAEGWGQVADDLLDRVEGLRASLDRRDRVASQHAAERVEPVLAWLSALGVAAAGSPAEVVAAAG
jgi:hypothetical protein